MNHHIDGEPTLRVSVIIPAYRAGGTVGRAVDSVLAQTVPVHEILVIDDGSPDDVAAPLAPYGDCVTLIRKPNGGAASARNLGLDRATGDFIAFLDADDYWEPHKLETQLGLFEQHPELGLVAGASYTQHPDAPERSRLKVWPRYADRVLNVAGSEAFFLAAIIWTGTVLVRRSVIGAERFVSGLEPAEDRDLWVRLAVAAPVYWFAEPLATAVMEANSLSRSSLQRDCVNFLKVIDRQRNLIGWRAAWMWRSHTYFRWAGNEQSPTVALGKLTRSIAAWPVPFPDDLCPVRGARLKLLIVTGMRMLGLRRDRP